MAEQAAKAADQAAFGIGAAYPRDALEIVATGAKPLPDLLDALKAIPAVSGGVLLIVLGAEVAEVPLEYSMELVAAAGNVLIPYRGRDRDCRAHINTYGRSELPASDRGRGHRAPHNIAHLPDAFSSLRSCEGAGDDCVKRSRQQGVDSDNERNHHLKYAPTISLRSRTKTALGNTRSYI